MKALILKSAKRDFNCVLLDTKEEIVATALANLVKGDDSLVVGDLVEVQEESGEWKITERHERKNHIYRIIIRENKKKVTAANVDHLVVLTSVSRPQFKRGILDRYLVRAAQWNIEPVVVFNKMDEYQEDEFDINFEADRLKGIANCYEVCALDSNYQMKYLENGLENLREKLKGKTAIFLGQSGVGKSKTINMLSNNDVELRTNEVSKKSGKGSHTTTWSEIINCGDFYLIDSPGIRSFSLEDLSKDDLIFYFPDLAQVARNCKFNNCNHSEEAKGCAFHEIRESEEEEDKMLITRLESFTKIFEEVSAIPEWKK